MASSTLGDATSKRLTKEEISIFSQSINININLFNDVFDPSSYAVVAFTGLFLQNHLVNGETSLLSITEFHPIELAGDPGTIFILCLEILPII